MSKKELIQFGVIILLSAVMGAGVRYYLGTKNPANNLAVPILSTKGESLAKTDLPPTNNDINGNNETKNTEEIKDAVNQSDNASEKTGLETALSEVKTVEINLINQPTLDVPFTAYPGLTIKNIRSSATLQDGSILNLSLLELIDPFALNQNKISFSNNVDLNQLYHNFAVLDNKLSFSVIYNEVETSQNIIATIINNPFITNSTSLENTENSNGIVNPFTGANTTQPRSVPRRTPSSVQPATEL